MQDAQPESEQALWRLQLLREARKENLRLNMHALPGGQLRMEEKDKCSTLLSTNGKMGAGLNSSKSILCKQKCSYFSRY